MGEREAWERHPNIGGMAGMLLHIHDSFRATSKALRALSGDSSPAAEARMRQLFAPLARTLHHHHHAEEEMLFPLVRERSGEAPATLIDDHQTLMARVAEVRAALDDQHAATLAPLLEALDVELCDHLAREEAIAVPMLLELTREETFRMLYGLGGQGLKGGS